MNRINKLFSDKKDHLLSLYFCAGYPTTDGTCEVIESMQDAGIDMVEIGIPFSDPMADGDIIQKAAVEALRNNMSLRLLFEQLKNVRQNVHIPLVLMGYLNPILHYGFEKFCQSCNACGIDGIIIPDLPFEEYLKNYKALAEHYNIRIIMLITPETGDERIRLIDDYTDGFIYMVSSAATTGTQNEFDDVKQTYFTHVNEMGLKNPRMIGFGISNRRTLESAQANAAGAIIGSKFVMLQGESKSPREALTKLFDILKK